MMEYGFWLGVRAHKHKICSQMSCKHNTCKKLKEEEEEEVGVRASIHIGCYFDP